MVGLIHLVEKIYQSTADEIQGFVSFGAYDFLSALEKPVGVDQTRDNLISVSEMNPYVKEFAAGVTAFRTKGMGSLRRKKSSKMPYNDLKSWLSSADMNNAPVRWSAWGKDAPDEDILLAAEDLLLLAEEEVRKITIYLSMFQHRMFPLDPTRLINWAGRIDNRDVWGDNGTVDYEVRRSLYALNALELVMDWRVRDLALSLIESKNNAGRAVGLIGLNFVEGDWQLIEELTHSNSNADDYHSLGWSVLDVFDAHPLPEAAAVFQNLYELGTCSSCRERFVRRLASLNAISEKLIEECKYDCNLDLRQWALTATI
jgi:hypothetical protein